LDIAIVKDVARRYAYDVERLRIYHKSPQPNVDPLINRHKIAGYLAYWVCKLRPISLNNKDAYLNGGARSRLYINEAFAMYLAVGRLRAERIKDGVTAKEVVDRELMDAMLYGLRYRPITGDTLSMAFHLMEKTAGQQ